MILLFRQFLRSSLALYGLVILLICSVVACLVGKQHITELKNTQTESQKYQKHQIEYNVKYFPTDLGYMLYYQRFGIANTIMPLQAFAIGHRDLNPSVIALTVRNLEAQRYDGDFINPYNSFVGNIDLSFVIIYLFPLVLIAFGYNVISGEKENGTWNLLNTQSDSKIALISKMIFARMFPVFAIYIGITLIAGAVLRLPFNQALFSYILLGLMYLFFWLSLLIVVLALDRSSTTNALSLALCYLILLVLLPSLTNNYLAHQYPIPEALENNIKQRKGYHEKWDMDHKETLSKFFTKYPQFSHYKVPDQDFNWPIYYAMQQQGDDDAAASTQGLFSKLKMRDEAALQISKFIPTLLIQLGFTRLAKSDLLNHIKFLEAAGNFHAQKRLHFYPKIFENEQASNQDWSTLQSLNYFNEDEEFNWPATVLPLFWMILIMISSAVIISNYGKFFSFQ